MTQVDFYVLQDDSVEAQQHFACRLIEKAVRQGNRVLLATKDAAETRQMNEALWSFRPDAFVPHLSLGDADAEHAPVLISHEGDDANHHDVLVNLRLSVPEQFSRFQRLAEIVIQEPTVLNNSRKNFSFFKSRGYPVTTHKL